MRILFGLFATVMAGAALAVPTQIDIRVLAKDAKFIGTGMGDMAVTIRSVQTGEMLAEGLVKGGTGDTDLIMRQPWERGRPISGGGSASFSASIDIDRPTLVEVAVRGPLNFPHASQLMSTTHWVIPGRHINGGDGLRFELPGFVVTATATPAELPVNAADGGVAITATVTMMCGCPLTPGGLWNSDDYEIAAIIYRDEEQVAETKLDYAGSASEFAVTWRPEEPGYYEIVVFAYDAANGNTGTDQTGVLVQP